MSNDSNRRLRASGRFSRRGFLAGTVAAVAVPHIVPASALGKDGQTAPNDRITIGMLGVGKRGSSSLSAMRPLPEHQVVAIAGRRDRALRAALGTLQGAPLMGAVNSIDARRDGQAVAKLQELGKNPDPENRESTISPTSVLRLPRTCSGRCVRSILAESSLDASVGPTDSCKGNVPSSVGHAPARSRLPSF